MWERIRSKAEGGFKLGAQTHLQWRLNGTEREDRPLCRYGVVRLEAKEIPRSTQVTRSPWRSLSCGGRGWRAEGRKPGPSAV